MPLSIQPVDFSEACEFVRRLHRHHRPPVGSKLQIAANDGEKIVGVLIAGRPVARFLDDGLTLEVTRCCTDGTRNVCSLLYGAAWRVAKGLGYVRMITYTLPEEGGHSLRGAGWKQVHQTTGDTWSRPNQPNRNSGTDDHPLGVKWRWEVFTGEAITRFRIEATAEPQNLFAAVS